MITMIDAPLTFSLFSGAPGGSEVLTEIFSLRLTFWCLSHSFTETQLETTTFYVVIGEKELGDQRIEGINTFSMNM